MIRHQASTTHDTERGCLSESKARADWQGSITPLTSSGNNPTYDFPRSFDFASAWAGKHRIRVSAAILNGKDSRMEHHTPPFKVAIARLKHQNDPPRSEPKRKARTQRACENCRKRKVRCTGEPQCRNCVDQGLSCAYSLARRDRLNEFVSNHPASCLCTLLIAE